MQTVRHSDEMLAAVPLHDTVEDADITIDEIHRLFGYEVVCLVEMLTDASKATDGNRAMRKAIDREHTAKASPAGKAIKLDLSSDPGLDSFDLVSQTAKFSARIRLPYQSNVAPTAANAADYQKRKTKQRYA